MYNNLYNERKFSINIENQVPRQRILHSYREKGTTEEDFPPMLQQLPWQKILSPFIEIGTTEEDSPSFYSSRYNQRGFSIHIYRNNYHQYKAPGTMTDDSPFIYNIKCNKREYASKYSIRHHDRGYSIHI